ncbi:MAG: hypothetical protein ABSD59_24120 [Terracidiphilus sp.]|jgi:phosphinothricin acetyltransferase
MSAELEIRRATANDAERLADIFNWYVAYTIVTFGAEPVTASDMRQRITDKLAKYDRIVGEQDQWIMGYAYYAFFRLRVAYSRTVESVIYLSQDTKGK